jgi:tetratricopeptide (TPR) repeat protein
MRISDDLLLKDVFAAVIGYYQMKEYGECMKKIEIGLRWADLDSEDMHDLYFYRACCEDELGMYRQAYDTVRTAYKLLPGCIDCDELYRDILSHMGKEVERLFVQQVDLEKAEELLGLLRKDEHFSDDYHALSQRLDRLQGPRADLATGGREFDA